MSSSDQILPPRIRGKVRGSREVHESSKRKTANEAFNARCPPDVQPNTRIIALCGITDYSGPFDIPSNSHDDEPASKQSRSGTLIDRISSALSLSKRKERGMSKVLRKQGLAGPREDGWFFSDFFLFHHIFQNIGANQIWMACESPKHLVKRYSQYTHGTASGDHRVVLDKSLLQQPTKFNNFRLCSRESLLEDFLTTLKSEITIAADNDQPVLLLLFGHGEPKTYGIAIGGSGPPDKAPRLHTHHIVRAIGCLNVSLTVMTASCYGGGWVYEPELNISAFTAAGPEVESRSWGFSIGGRSHGSIWATAVRDAFVEMDSKKATQFNSLPSDEDDSARDSSSTFTILAQVIHDTLLNEVDVSLGTSHEIRFAAQDDGWSEEWRKRSGIPLARFLQQWDTLQRLPPQQDTVAHGARLKGGVAAAGTSPSHPKRKKKPAYGLHAKFNKAQAFMIIREMAHEYLSSFPGTWLTGPNRETLVDSQRLMTDATQLADWKLERLQHALAYRLDTMTVATGYKDILGLDVADCHLFDLEEWKTTNAQSGEPSTIKGKAPEISNQSWQTYERFHRMILKSDIFADPTGNSGWAYDKPVGYLAAAFIESQFNHENVVEALETLLTEKNKRVKALTMRIYRDRTSWITARKVAIVTGSSSGLGQAQLQSPLRLKAPGFVICADLRAIIESR
ncbi:MAG: hypothetical protein Q9212_002474 [Teloschistes hypoglaucus]